MRALPVPQEGWRLLPSCTQPWKLRDTQWQSVPTLLPPPQSPLTLCLAGCRRGVTAEWNAEQNWQEAQVAGRAMGE